MKENTIIFNKYKKLIELKKINSFKFMTDIKQNFKLFQMLLGITHKAGGHFQILLQKYKFLARNIAKKKKKKFRYHLLGI
jgi:hypothetical protein